MTIEVATYINQLDYNLPDHDDFVSEGDDHARLIKKTLKNTFPNLTGAMNASQTELNFAVGVTSAILHVASLAALPVAVGTTTPVAGTWTDNTTTGKRRATGTGALGLATDTHADQIGPTAGLNLAISQAALQARSAGVAATLALNPLGGLVSLGLSGDTANPVMVQGVRTQIRAGDALMAMFQNLADGAPAINAAIDANWGIYTSTGTRRAFFGFSASLDLVVQNDSQAGAVRLRGVDAGLAIREMLVLNPGGLASLAYAGAVKLQTSATGATTTGTHIMDQLNTLGAGNNNVDGVWNFGSLSSIIARATAQSLGGNAGFQVGPTAGLNTAIMNGNIIQTRSNGAIALLYLNYLGGSVQLGQPAGGRAFWDDATKTFSTLDGANLSATGTLTVSGTGTHNVAGTLNATQNLRRNNVDVVDVQRAVNTATGLQGGGVLTADRTIDYDLQALGGIATIDYNDLFLLRDVSVAGAGSHVKGQFYQIRQFRPVLRSASATLDGTADAFTEQIWNSTGAGTLTLPALASTFNGNRIRFRMRNTGPLSILGWSYNGAKVTSTITMRGGMAEAVCENGEWFVTGDFGNPFDEGRFESTAVAVATSGAIAHGLAGQPDEFQVVLRCATADNGYSPGDEVDILSTRNGSGSVAGTAWASSTQIGWGLVLVNALIAQKGTGTNSAIASGNWGIVVKARRYRA